MYFVSAVLLVWGILEIVLFFKIWRMTDDVHALKQKLCQTQSSQPLNESRNMRTPAESHNNITVGMTVWRASDNRKMKVVRIDPDGKIECDAGLLNTGISAYRIEDLIVNTQPVVHDVVEETKITFH